MTCRATRLPVVPKGWVCSGEGLTIVMVSRMDGVDIPIVCPTDRLSKALEGDGAEIYRDHRPAPSELGDHLHLVLKERS
jgi:hypothetical protein